MTGKKNGPIKASEVSIVSDKTPEQLQQERTMRAVHGRIAKRTALRNAGADVPPPSADVAATVEQRLKSRERKVMMRSDARRAVARRLRGQS